MRNLKSLKHLTISGAVQGVDHLLTFQFTMQSGLVRSHHFHYMDCEILNAVFDESDCSYIKVRPKVLSQLFEHFYRSPEVIASATPTTFAVKSFHAPTTSAVETLRYMNTGLNMKMRDFEVYDYRADTDKVDMIFCMREVAAFVGFCEAIDSGECDCFFSAGGKAMKYCSKQDLINTQLVLATIEYSSQEPSILRAQQQQPVHRNEKSSVDGGERFGGGEGGHVHREEGEEEEAKAEGEYEEGMLDPEDKEGNGMINEQKEEGNICIIDVNPYVPLPAMRNEDEMSTDRESARGIYPAHSREGGVSTHSTTHSSADDNILRIPKRHASSKKPMHARKRLLEESSSDDD